MSALANVKVFDHPERSRHARSITHAHFFDLKTGHLPDVEAVDDPSQAVWLPIEKILGMEERFFDDRFPPYSGPLLEADGESSLSPSLQSRYKGALMRLACGDAPVGT